MNAVADQLAADYPPGKLGWVNKLTWDGPKEIGLDGVDFSNQKKWNAWHEPHRVKKMAAKITKRAKKGRRIKPVVLVDTPGDSKLKVVDGHHRSLAYAKLGKPIWGYTAKVPQVEGPWDEFHASQYHAGDRETTDEFTAKTAWEHELRDEHGRWYHGTRATLQPGDLVEPRSGRTFALHDLDGAKDYAKTARDLGTPKVYEVEPAGPNLSAFPSAYHESDQPLRVTAQVWDSTEEKMHPGLSVGPRLPAAQIRKQAQVLAWDEDRQHADTLASNLADTLARSVDVKSMAAQWADIIGRQAPGPGAAESFVHQHLPKLRAAVEAAVAPAWRDAWHLGVRSAKHQVAANPPKGADPMNPEWMHDGFDTRQPDPLTSLDPGYRDELNSHGIAALPQEHQ